MRIAVVDDDPAVRDSTRVLLETLLATVTVFESAEAMFHEAANVADVILLDLLLPGDDGLRAYHRLQEAIRTPVILISGHDDLSGQAAALGAPLLCKPYSVEELAAALVQVAPRRAG